MFGANGPLRHDVALFVGSHHGERLRCVHQYLYLHRHRLRAAPGHTQTTRPRIIHGKLPHSAELRLFIFLDEIFETMERVHIGGFTVQQR